MKRIRFLEKEIKLPFQNSFELLSIFQKELTELASFSVALSQERFFETKRKESYPVDFKSLEALIKSIETKKAIIYKIADAYPSRNSFDKFVNSDILVAHIKDSQKILNLARRAVVDCKTKEEVALLEETIDRIKLAFNFVINYYNSLVKIENERKRSLDRPSPALKTLSTLN